MTIKLKVGEKYELNNGLVGECTRMDGDDPNAIDDWGYGPYVVDDCFYHEDGRFGNDSPDMELSLKRHIPIDKSPAHITLDYFTNDAIRSAVLDALENQNYDVARSLIDHLDDTK